MFRVRRVFAALAVPCLLASPAAAQIGLTPVVETQPRTPGQRLLPDFSPPRGDFRDVGQPRRNGLIAAVPINGDLQIGIGRFRVVEPARPRTNMEPERAPTDLRRREKGVAAIGMSLRF
jgi:hypothetical protein